MGEATKINPLSLFSQIEYHQIDHNNHHSFFKAQHPDHCLIAHHLFVIPKEEIYHENHY